MDEDQFDTPHSSYGGNNAASQEMLVCGASIPFLVDPTEWMINAHNSVYGVLLTSVSESARRTALNHTCGPAPTRYEVPPDDANRMIDFKEAFGTAGEEQRVRIGALGEPYVSSGCTHCKSC